MDGLQFPVAGGLQTDPAGRRAADAGRYGPGRRGRGRLHRATGTRRRAAASGGADRSAANADGLGQSRGRERPYPGGARPSPGTAGYRVRSGNGAPQTGRSARCGFLSGRSGGGGRLPGSRRGGRAMGGAGPVPGPGRGLPAGWPRPGRRWRPRSSTRGAFPEPSLWRLAAGLIEALERGARGRAHPPGPQAGQRAAGRGRAAADRLRYRPGAWTAPSTHRQSGHHRSALPRSCPRSRPRRPVAPRPASDVFSLGQRAGLRRDRDRVPVRDRPARHAMLVPGGARARPMLDGPAGGTARARSDRCLAKDPADAAVPGRPGRGGGRPLDPGRGRATGAVLAGNPGRPGPRARRRGRGRGRDGPVRGRSRT